MAAGMGPFQDACHKAFEGRRFLAAMRLPWAVPVLALLLGGCLASPSQLPSALAPPPLPAAPEPFTYLLCQGELLRPLDLPRSGGCNFRATPASEGPAAEVTLAVNPLDPLNLVGGAKDFTLGLDARCGKYNVWSGVFTTFDGGRTWSHSLLPGYPGDARHNNLSQYACGSDPVVVFGPGGEAYYISLHVTGDPAGDAPIAQLAPVLGYGSKNSGIAVTRSDDGGRTWGEPHLIIHTEEPNQIFDKQWAAVDMRTGQLYVTFVHTQGGLWGTRSDDRGATWTEPVPIAVPQDLPGGPGQVQFGQVGVSPDGVVHFTYWATFEAGQLSGIFHKSSSDQGQTWSAPHLVAPFVPVLDLQFTHKYRIVPNPALAVDTAKGTLYVSYPFFVAEGAAPAGNLDVYVARSEDGGATWSAPVRANDEPLGLTDGQWQQAIAVGPDGTVHLTWLDYREDPTGQFARLYYSFSKDAAQTFAPNRPVGDVLFDGTGGYHQSGAGTIGDYTGLAVSTEAVYPFWADTRHGRNDVFSAIIPS